MGFREDAIARARAAKQVDDAARERQRERERERAGGEEGARKWIQARVDDAVPLVHEWFSAVGADPAGTPIRALALTAGERPSRDMYSAPDQMPPTTYLAWSIDADSFQGVVHHAERWARPYAGELAVPRGIHVYLATRATGDGHHWWAPATTQSDLGRALLLKERGLGGFECFCKRYPAAWVLKNAQGCLVYFDYPRER